MHSQVFCIDWEQILFFCDVTWFDTLWSRTITQCDADLTRTYVAVTVTWTNTATKLLRALKCTNLLSSLGWSILTCKVISKLSCLFFFVGFDLFIKYCSLNGYPSSCQHLQVTLHFKTRLASQTKLWKRKQEFWSSWKQTWSKEDEQLMTSSRIIVFFSLVTLR